MRRARIAIVTGTALARNPRAFKEAASLSRAGYDVVVFGASTAHDGSSRDTMLASRAGFEFVSVGSLAAPGLLNLGRSYWRRVRTRFANEFARLTRIETRNQLGYYVPELLRGAIRASADYYIVHMEQAMWVGAELLARGKRVGVDIEDWYSEDLLPEARRSRPLKLLRALERDLLCGARHTSCPSRAMSDALGVAFDCRRPVVLYNAFEWGDRDRIDHARKDRGQVQRISIHWFSQTLGPGRGLEDLMSALPHVDFEAEIHLRGARQAGFREWLFARAPASWRPRLFLHEPVDPEQLLSRVAEHDIGFAGEMTYCRNKDLTASNKMLHYLLGGLAVVASDTAGQREVASKALGAVTLYPSGDPRALAERLNTLLREPATLSAAKNAALMAAREVFCWERQAPVLIAAVETALA